MNSDENRRDCKFRRKNLCDGTCDRNAKVLFEKEDCIAYQVKNQEGELFITEYSVFPGIWLCYKEAHAQKFTYPDSWPAGLLEITHCREGRIEYDAGDQFFDLSEGDMSVSKSTGKGITVYCPARHYHGISIVIDSEHAPQCLSCFLDDVCVDPALLLSKFCGVGRFFIMRSAVQLEHIFSELYSIPEKIQKGYFKVKVLELLLFLSSLDPGLSQENKRSCSKAQAALAKKVCEYVDSHMEFRLTIEQLAGKFYVSPAWLKKCFYSVYAKSVQAYIREYKMQSAAHALKNTDKTIAEIAAAVGYENSSKFSKAFRCAYGLSPTLYRQRKNQEVS